MYVEYLMDTNTVYIGLHFFNSLICTLINRLRFKANIPLLVINSKQIETASIDVSLQHTRKVS